MYQLSVHEWRPQDAVKIRNGEYVEANRKEGNVHFISRPLVIDPRQAEAVVVFSVLEEEAPARCRPI